jgi:hypothetical protein
VLFHHEPSHDDAALEEMGRRAAREFPNVCVAREEVVNLG